MRLSLPAALVAAGSLVLAAGVPQTPAPAAQRSVFRGGVNLVTVDAYPRREGRIVEGLTPADFEVTEDGKPQAIDQFEFVRVEPSPESGRVDPGTIQAGNAAAADPHNRAFVIYLDEWHVTTAGSHDIRRPLVDFLNRTLGDTDLFGVMTAKMPANALTFGRKTLTIENELDRYWAWGASDSRMPDRADPEEALLQSCGFGGITDTLVQRHREDQTLRSLEELSAYLGHLRGARTVVLLVSGGWTLFGPDQSLSAMAPPPGQPRVGVVGGRLGVLNGANGNYDLPACTRELIRLAMLDDAERMRNLIERAQLNNVAFYPVDPGGLSAPVSSGGMDALHDRIDSLLTMASNTGGVAIVNTNDLRSGVAKIANDVSAYYLLGYYSTNPKPDGKTRYIKVRVKQPKVSVTARRGYVAPTEAEVKANAMLSTAAAAESAVPAGVAAAFDALGTIDSDVELRTYGVERADGTALDVVAEISTAVAASGRWSAGGTVEVTVSGDANEPLGAATGRLDAGANGVLVRVPVTGTAGVWHVAVRLRGGNNTLTGRFALFSGTSGLTGDPIPYRGTPAAQSALRPVADFLFRRTERLHIEWPLAAAIDRRSARVLDRRAQPLPLEATVTERDAAGAPVVAVDLNLAPLAPGDYAIELTVGKGTETEQKYLAFRVR